jgi:uncharacterized protein (DUF433 family)
MSAIHPHVDLSKYIEVRAERAYIRGRRLPVMYIASAERDNHLTIIELAKEFSITPQEVLAAMLYLY